MAIGSYKHVVVVGLDGAGTFIKKADTPNIDRIFKNGAITHSGLSCNPTSSAEVWASILTGVSPEIHATSHRVACSTPYPCDSKFPTLFRRIRTKMPKAELGVFCEWRVINFGIVEHNQNVTSFTADDAALTPVACEYIKAKKPTFLFVHLGTPDTKGHAHGYGSKIYMDQINKVDSMVGDIYTAIEDAGMKEDTLFMICTDHGGTPSNAPGHHDFWSDVEKYVSFAIVGKTVRKTEIKNMNNRNIPAIVLYALGIDSPKFDLEGWTSQVPPEIFDDPSIPEYKDISSVEAIDLRVHKVNSQTRQPVCWAIN